MSSQSTGTTENNTNKGASGFVKSANPAVPPEVLAHKPTGTSVFEEDAILEESGRFYHSYEQGRYFLPNDPTEQDRLDLQHAQLQLVLGGKLSLAPLFQSPAEVLDVGCGTGIWALDFAEKHPTSHVTGTDLSAIQPKQHKARNCDFIREDSEKEWTFPRKFDYVHLRLTFTCFDDPKGVMETAYDHMNPGAWMEYQETMFLPKSANGSVEGMAIQKWCDLCNRGAAAARGRDILVAPKLRGWFIETGFEEVTERRFVLPVSPWPEDPVLKKAGMFGLSNLLDGVRGIGWKMLRAAGLSIQETEELTEAVKSEIRNVSHCLYFEFYVIYGRKPTTS